MAGHREAAPAPETPVSTDRKYIQVRTRASGTDVAIESAERKYGPHGSVQGNYNRGKESLSAWIPATIIDHAHLGLDHEAKPVLCERGIASMGKALCTVRMGFGDPWAGP
jgi:hypothetical protein